MPQDFSYAVEIRNAGILVLSIVTCWPAMEWHIAVLRLLTPLNMSYEAAKKRAEPYAKIVRELPDMRKEAVVLIKNAIGHNRRAYVLVNNRLEGNAPLTVQALTDLLRTEN
jgi:hypothetical protein